MLYQSTAVCSLSAILLMACAAKPAAPVLAINQAPYDLRKLPSTVSDVVRLVKYIADNDLVAQEDFYTEDNLRALFGDQPHVKILRYARQTKGWVLGFFDLVEKSNEEPRYEGIDFDARRLIPETAENVCEFRIVFRYIQRAPDFVSVVSVLGRNWQEDKKEEFEERFALERELFNPPFPKAAGFMGNSIIVYGEPKGLLRVKFSAEGKLAEITYDHPRYERDVKDIFR